MTDFSSASYWAPRLAAELDAGGFEWLAGPAAVDFAERVVLDHLARRGGAGASSAADTNSATAAKPGTRAVSDTPVDPAMPADSAAHTSDDSCADSSRLRILHFGAGSSSLGPDLAARLAARGVCADIIDADYVDLPALPAASTSSSVTLARARIDVLDPAALASAIRERSAFDVVIDKSVADAISCGVAVRAPAGGAEANIEVEPLVALLANLHAATNAHATWASISYSGTRYDDLGPEDGWAILEKTLLAQVSGQPRLVDGRTVYEPETGVWGWVLERV
ncbi:hypothetical protein Q5752_000006 [Cryptotrichosporon argae]